MLQATLARACVLWARSPGMGRPAMGSGQLPCDRSDSNLDTPENDRRLLDCPVSMSPATEKASFSTNLSESDTFLAWKMAETFICSDNFEHKVSVVFCAFGAAKLLIVMMHDVARAMKSGRIERLMIITDEKTTQRDC
ncbi:hypothetical protein PRIPAC_77852 [Pristionchus pacificus]|uniref:Uncharacterized protein n=1 Tax=Pristionchus pacificus TaxID=54126 RepID=A0A2A6BH07_PRIPA|nr:hypothetical protein PRIPAC_77852 [Pristionchus pacificus]|eukprot:PDM65205.1 hypothetical protein PRIPAC_52147 [Pristionchus pacificus]